MLLPLWIVFLYLRVYFFQNKKISKKYWPSKIHRGDVWKMTSFKILVSVFFKSRDPFSIHQIGRDFIGNWRKKHDIFASWADRTNWQEKNPDLFPRVKQRCYILYRWVVLFQSSYQCWLLGDDDIYSNDVFLVCLLLNWLLSTVCQAQQFGNLNTNSLL